MSNDKNNTLALNYTLKPHSFDDFSSGNVFNQAAHALKADHVEATSDDFHLIFSEVNMEQTFKKALAFKKLWNDTYSNLGEIVSVEISTDDSNLLDGELYFNLIFKIK